jgi:hypothetical protein
MDEITLAGAIVASLSIWVTQGTMLKKLTLLVSIKT